MVRGNVRDASKTSKINYDIDMSIHNKFDIEILDRDTGEVKEKAEGYNIIKDTLWNRLCTISDWPHWFSHIHFGSGTGTPTPDSIGLFEPVGCKIFNQEKTPIESEVFPEEGYAYSRKWIRLEPTEYVGKTITEVGIGYGYENESVCTHAMLQDMNGNPVAIEKTDTDIINIYATVYVHWNPEGYENGKIKICHFKNFGPSKGSIVSELLDNVRVYDAIDWNGYFFGGPPCITHQTATSSTSMKKNVANRTYTITVGRVNVDNGNNPFGLKSFLYRGILVTSPSDGLPGSSIVGESIGTGDGTTSEFNTKFPLPSNASIYVNGEMVTDVVVDDTTPGSSFFACSYFEILPNYSEDFVNLCMSLKTSNLSENTGSASASCGGPAVFYNPFYQFGIKQIMRNHWWMADIRPEISDDLVNWYKLEPIKESNATRKYPVPEEYQFYRYWKFYSDAYTSQSQSDAILRITPVIPFKNNIRFNTPPAEGSVITADYYTPVVAKDIDHVFDMSITIHLGEYKE